MTQALSCRQNGQRVCLALRAWFSLIVLSGPLTSCVERGDTGANPTAGAEIEITPSDIPADGVTRAAIDIWVRDGDGTPLAQVPVTLTASGPVTLEQPTAPTDALGHARAALYADTPGTVSLRLHATLLREAIITPATASVRLTPSQKSLGNRLSVAVLPSVASVDVATSRSVVGRLVSAGGEPVAGAAVTLVSSRLADRVSPTSVTTSAAGEFVATLLSTQSGIAQVTATIDGKSMAQASASFLPGAPDAAHTYFLTQLGNEVTADGLGSSAEVFVGDQYGNPVSYAPVSVAAPSQNVTLVPPAGVADGGGIFHTTVSATDLGSGAIVIDAGTSTSQHNVQLVVGPASAVSSTLSVSPALPVADGVSSASVSAVFADAAGHPRVGDAVLWTSSDVNDVFTPTSGVTDSTGLVRTAVRSTHASSVTLYASDGNLMLSTGASFVAGPPSVANSTLVVAPSPCVAAASANVTLTAQLRDAFGNPTPAIPLQWAASDNTVVFSAPTTSTDAGGQGQVTLAATHSGNVLLSAGFGASTLTAALSVVPAALSLSHSSLDVSPAMLVADGNAQATVTFTARDDYNNAIAQEAVTLTGSGVSSSFSTPGGTTDSQGLFVGQVSGTQAGTLTVTAQLGPQSLSAPVVFVAGSPNAAASVLVLSPNASLAGSSIAATAVFRDAYGNPTPSRNVTFSAGPQATASPNAGVTDASGSALTQLTSTVAQNFVVEAVSGPVTLVAPWSVGPAAPDASTSSLLVSPNVIAAGMTAQLTVQLLDAFGNPAPGQALLVSGGSNILAGPQAVTTDAQGRATLSGSPTLAQNAVLYATGANITLSAALRVIAAAPSGTGSLLTVAPASPMATSVTADGNSAFGVSGHLVDAFGNAAAGQVVTLAAGVTRSVGMRYYTSSGTRYANLSVNGALQQNAINLPGGNNWRLLQGYPLTLSSGVSQVTYTNQGGSIYVDSLSVANQQVVTSLEAESGQLSAGCTIGASQPNYLGTGYVSVPAAGSVTVNFTMGATNSNAYVVFRALTPNTMNWTMTLNGNTSGLIAATYASDWLSTPMVAIAPQVGNNTLTISSTLKSFLLDQISIIRRSQDTLYEAENATLTTGASVANALVGYTGTGYVYAIASPTAAFTLGIPVLSDNFSQPFFTTDANGFFSGSWTSTVAEAKTLSATAGNLVLSQGANFVAGPPSLAQSILASSSNGTVTAGRPTYFSVQLLDAYQNPVPSQAVSFSSPTTSSFFPSSTSVDAWGSAATTATLTLAGPSSVCVQAANAYAQCLNTTVLAAAASAAQSSVVLSPNTTTAGASSNVTLMLLDAYGNPVSGQPVAISGGANIAVTSSMTATNANGVSSGVVQTNTAQNAVLSVFAGNVSLSVPWSIMPGPASASTSWLAATGNTTANNVNVSLVSGHVADVFGNPLGNASVALTSSVVRDFSLRYSSTAHTGMTITVNGVRFPLSAVAINSGSSSNWQFISIQNNPGWPCPQRISLSSGNNTFAPSTTTCLNFDQLQIYSGNTNQVVEAETGVLGGSATIDTANTGFIGTGYVNLPQSSNSFFTVQFFNPGASGNVFLTYRYQTGSTGSVAVTLNGNQTSNTFTGVSQYWFYAPQIQLPAQSGINTLTILAKNYQILIDNLLVTFPGSTQAIEAETGVVQGGAQIQNSVAGYSGTGYVSGICGTGTDTVQFSLPSEAFSSPLVSTDNNGNFQSSYRSSVAESKQLTAQTGNAIWGASATFVQGSPLSATSPFFISAAANIIAGQPKVAAIQLRDAQTNLVPGAQVTFTLGGTNSTLSPSIATSTSTGSATTTFVVTQTGNQQICSQLSGQNTTCLPFVVYPGSPNVSTSSVTTAQNTITAGTTTTASVLLRNDYAVPIQGQNVVFVAGGGLSFTPASVTTDANGQAQTSVTAIYAGNATVQANAGNVLLAGNLRVVASTPNALYSSMSVTPGAVADNNSVAQINAHLADVYGNPAVGQNAVFRVQVKRNFGTRYAGQGDSNTVIIVNGVAQPASVYYDSTSGYGYWSNSGLQTMPFLSGNNNVKLTNNNGFDNFDYFTVSYGDFTQNIEAELGAIGGVATVSSSQSGYSGTGYVAFPASGNSSITTSLLSAVSSSNALIGLQIYSPVAGSGGALSLSVNGNAVGPIYVSWGSATGWASSSFVSTSLLAGNNLLVVQGANIPVYIDQILVNQRGPMQLVEAESGVFAGSAVLESVYTPYSGAGYAAGVRGTATVTDTVNIGSESLSATTLPADMGGNVSLQWRSGVAETKQLSLVSGNLTLSANYVFSPGPPVSGLSSFALSANSATAGNAIYLAVAVLDQYSNFAPNSVIAFTSADPNGTFGVNSAVSNSFGRAQSSYSSTVSGQHHICAQIGNLYNLCQNVQVKAANSNLSASSVTIASPTAVANGSSTVVVQGTVRDLYGNPVPQVSLQVASGALRWLSARYGSSDATNASSTSISLNGASGSPWFFGVTSGWSDWVRTDRYPYIMQQNNVFMATLVTTPTVNFDSIYIHPSNATSIIEAETTSLSGNIVSANVWSNYSGSGYLDWQSSTGATATFNYVGVPGDLNRDISIRYAVLASTPTVSLSLNGNVVAPLVDLGVTGAWNAWQESASAPVTLLPGNNTIQLKLLSANMLVDYFRLSEISPRTTTVQAELASSVLGGATVASNWAGYEGTGYIDYHSNANSSFALSFARTDDVITPSQPMTDSAGNFLVSLTSTIAEQKTVSVAIGGAIFAQNVVFTPGPPVATASSLGMAASTLSAGAPSLLGAVARDIYQNPVPSVPVQLSVSPNQAVFGANAIVTNSRGVASATVDPSVAGPAQICGNFNGLFTLCANVLVVAAAPNATLSTLSVSPNSVVAGANISLSGSFRDSYNNICSNQSLSVAMQPNSNGSFGPFATTTDANGQMALVVATAPAASFVAYISSAIGGLATSFTVNANVASALRLSGLRALPSGLINDLQVTAVDNFNNVASPPYTGSITFMSSDTNAIVPMPYTFVSGDGSVHKFVGQTQLYTQGNQIVSAYAPATPSIAGSSTAFVQPPIVAPFQAIVFGSSPNVCLQPTGLSSTANTVMAGAICTQNHYQIGALGSDQTWRYLNQCLQPLGGLFVGGQNIVLAPCTTSLTQRWTAAGAMVVSTANSNFCVDATSIASGGPLSLTTCASPNAPSLALVEASRSRDVTYDSSVFGPQFNPGQFLGDTYANARTLAWLTGEDDFRLDANNCLYVTDPSISPNAQVQVGPCAGGNAQKWVVNQNRIMPKYRQDLCLTRTTFPAQIQTCATLTGTNSFFNLLSLGYGVQVRPYASLANNICMQSVQYPATDNSNVILAPCNQSYQQIFMPGSEWAKNPFEYLFANPGDFNYPFLAFGVGGGNRVGLPATLRLASNNNNLSFVLFKNSSSSIPGVGLVTNAGPQLYVDANPLLYNNVVSLGPYGFAPSRQIIFEPRPAMVSAGGNLCLSVQNGNYYYNQPLVWAPCSQSSNQKMFFPYSIGAAPAPTTSMPVAFNGLCLDIVASGNANKSLQMATCTYATTQYWNIGPGPLAVVNGSGLCLDGNSAASGAMVQAQNCTGMANQNVAITFF